MGGFDWPVKIISFPSPACFISARLTCQIESLQMQNLNFSLQSSYRQFTNQNQRLQRTANKSTRDDDDSIQIHDDDVDGCDGKMIPQKRFPNSQLIVVTCHVFLFSE